MQFLKSPTGYLHVTVKLQRRQPIRSTAEMPGNRPGEDDKNFQFRVSRHVQFGIVVDVLKGNLYLHTSLIWAISYIILGTLIGRQCQICAKTESDGVIESNNCTPDIPIFELLGRDSIEHKSDYIPNSQASTTPCRGSKA
jgi:hypothetical protein